MASELPDELRELAWFQDGILTGKQAVAGGLSREAVRWRLGTRQWQRMQTGVYAVFSGPPGRRAILWAAVLRAGPGAMLSYHTAAELAGLTDRPSPVIHVMLPVDRAVKPIPGVVLHRSGRAARALHPVLVPPRTRIEETVLDLAAAAATLMMPMAGSPGRWGAGSPPRRSWTKRWPSVPGCAGAPTWPR